MFQVLLLLFLLPIAQVASQFVPSCSYSTVSDDYCHLSNVELRYLPLNATELCAIETFCSGLPQGSYCYTARGQQGCQPAVFVDCPSGLVSLCQNGYICQGSTGEGNKVVPMTGDGIITPIPIAQCVNPMSNATTLGPSQTLSPPSRPVVSNVGPLSLSLPSPNASVTSTRQVAYQSMPKFANTQLGGVEETMTMTTAPSTTSTLTIFGTPITTNATTTVVPPVVPWNVPSSATLSPFSAPFITSTTTATATTFTAGAISSAGLQTSTMSLCPIPFQVPVRTITITSLPFQAQASTMTTTFSTRLLNSVTGSNIGTLGVESGVPITTMATTATTTTTTTTTLAAATAAATTTSPTIANLPPIVTRV